MGSFGRLPINSYDPITSSLSATINESYSHGRLYSLSLSNYYSTSQYYSISIKEKPRIAIPPKSLKIVGEYGINMSIYVDCELDRYPKDMATIVYNKDNSPLQYENYITYRIGEDGKDITIQNKFYVYSITNYAKPYLLNYVKREKPCKNTTSAENDKEYEDKYSQEVYDLKFIIDNHNCFYLQYDKSSKNKLYDYKDKESEFYYDDKYDGYVKYIDSNNISYDSSYEHEQYLRRLRGVHK